MWKVYHVVGDKKGTGYEIIRAKRDEEGGRWFKKADFLVKSFFFEWPLRGRNNKRKHVIKQLRNKIHCYYGLLCFALFV